MKLSFSVFRSVALAGVFFQFVNAHAARPMITDDARIVDDKSCQVESWVRHEHNRTELWALPGCNFTGGIEFTAGGGRLREDGSQSSDLVLQGKALIRPLTTNGWGAAATVGMVRHSAASAAETRDLYASVPLSFSFVDDKFTAHTNTGWLREGQSGKSRATWGLGTETQITNRVGLVAEAFGQATRDSFYQLGLRFWVVPDRVQIDTTYGNRIGGRGDQARWVSIGLRLLSPAFLP
jgi:hypothetical protein